MTEEPTKINMPAKNEEEELVDEAVKKFGEAALKDPNVALVVARFKDMAKVVNLTAAWLNGEEGIIDPKEYDQENHLKWLAQRYCVDVVFLLEQLGVVQVKEGGGSSSDSPLTFEQKNGNEKDKEAVEEDLEEDDELVE